MNAGKIFEKNFKDSIPEDVFFYRFRDGTASFNRQENGPVRFQQSNMCDCMLFDGRLFLLELKSHKGKSLPFSAIRDNQLKELVKANSIKDIHAGFIVNFRDIEKTYFVYAMVISSFMEHTERKSIPLEFFEKCGHEIPCRKLKVHYRYDLKGWLKDDNIK